MEINRRRDVPAYDANTFRLSSIHLPNPMIRMIAMLKKKKLFSSFIRACTNLTSLRIFYHLSLAQLFGVHNGFSSLRRGIKHVGRKPHATQQVILCDTYSGLIPTVELSPAGKYFFSLRQLNSFQGLKQTLDSNLQSPSARRKQDNESLLSHRACCYTCYIIQLMHFVTL